MNARIISEFLPLPRSCRWLKKALQAGRAADRHYTRAIAAAGHPFFRCTIVQNVGVAKENRVQL